ncbi:uncharacterized protein LOC143256347 [Tachypleus tridentatus]|uniref:uncharacterized protein LOC143256347 n=1 Tax=Tachypleus tridentatus TaxID=6853 RepID=UPI003FD48174
MMKRRRVLLIFLCYHCHQISLQISCGKKNINRCFAVWNESERKVMVSHPEIQQVADWMTTANNSSMYKNHEGIFLQLGLRTGCLLGVFIWKTNRGQACGGIRMLEYHSMEKYLQEGLRLSTRLGIKSALAGLWTSSCCKHASHYTSCQMEDPHTQTRSAAESNMYTDDLVYNILSIDG